MATTSRINEIVNKFVAEVTEEIQKESNARIQEGLQRFAEGLGTKTTKRRTTAGRSMKKPCAAPGGCEKNAAPRYHMMCKEHSEKMTKAQIDEARFVANQPGGIWYVMKHGDASAEKKGKRKAG